MTAVLTHDRPADTAIRPMEIVAPPAPHSAVFPPEPVDSRSRYWDVEVAGWRPSPVEDGC
jgi:hypothetical protein